MSTLCVVGLGAAGTLAYEYQGPSPDRKTGVTNLSTPEGGVTHA